MRLEVHSAANFLVQLARVKPDNGLTEVELEMFKISLSNVLSRRYEEHWFPEKPTKGSGYRCIRINKAMDPVIAQAGRNVGLPTYLLSEVFPRELTMWIDPAEVSYRIGEDGSICVLYEEGKLQDPKEDSNINPANCKEAMLILDPRNSSFSFEQTTTYVSG